MLLKEFAIAEKSGTLKPWRTLSTRSVAIFPPWFSVHRDQVELPSGRVVDDYYRIEAPDYALVCAILDDGKVIMERHYKQCLGKFLLTSPAGGIEPGEEPFQAAQRELLEETGYRANNWQALGAFTVDGTRGICRAHLFLADQLELMAAPSPDEMEECDLVHLDRNDISTSIADGSICLLPDIALLGMAFSTINQERRKPTAD